MSCSTMSFTTFAFVTNEYSFFFYNRCFSHSTSPMLIKFRSSHDSSLIIFVDIVNLLSETCSGKTGFPRLTLQGHGMEIRFFKDLLLDCCQQYCIKTNMTEAVASDDFCMIQCMCLKSLALFDHISTCYS